MNKKLPGTKKCMNFKYCSPNNLNSICPSISWSSIRPYFVPLLLSKLTALLAKPINENSLSRDNIVDLNFNNYSSLSEEIIAGYSQFNLDLSNKISVQSGIRYEDTVQLYFY